MSEDRRGRTGQHGRDDGEREDDPTTAMRLTDAETATAPLPFTGSESPPAESPPAESPPAESPPDGPAAVAGASPQVGERPVPTSAPRAGAPRVGPRADSRGARAGRRRARLALSHVEPWSVFVLSLIVALFLGVVLLVAVAVLYALLDGLGVLASVDTLAQELDLVGEGQPLFGLGRVLGLTAVIAAVDIVLITVLATLGAFLYNLCAALTGGVEVTLSERD